MLSSASAPNVQQLISEIIMWLEILKPYWDVYQFAGKHYDKVIEGHIVHIRCIAGVEWLVHKWFEIEVNHNGAIYRTGRQNSPSAAVEVAEAWVRSRIH